MHLNLSVTLSPVFIFSYEGAVLWVCSLSYTCFFFFSFSVCVFAAYIQTTRALMITGSIFGLPAVGMLLMSMPCISLGNDPLSSKNKRTVVGGVLIIIVGKRNVRQYLVLFTDLASFNLLH